MVFRIHQVRKFEQCPKKFWLSMKQKDAGFPYIHFPFDLTQLASQYLQIVPDDCFVGQTGDTTDASLAGLAAKTWLMHARFEAKSLRAKISFLKRVSLYEEEQYRQVDTSINDEELLVDYYVLARTPYPKEDEGRRIAMEVWLLKQCGVVVRELFLVHLNGQYVRQGELDVSTLFVTSPYFFKDENKPGKAIIDVVNKVSYDLTTTLEKMADVVQLDDVSMPFHLGCTKSGKCQYYDHCFKEDDLPDNSILFLSQTRQKYDMLANGISTMSDINLDDFPLSYLQYAQYQSALRGDVFVDQLALQSWMKSHLQKPYSYVDFEWDTVGIPMYAGMKPYDVLLFQYSLHVQENEELKHYEFIQTGDSRKAFIESLLSHLPASGSVIAYHAEGAEKLRLKELAEQFPEYAVPLLKICDRMVDLTYPFMNGVVYYPRMRGTFSLKKLLSVIQPDHNYADLQIGHGLQAVAAYRDLDGMSEETKAETVALLKEYCALDTYAMHVVMEDLKKRAGLQ